MGVIVKRGRSWYIDYYHRGRRVRRAVGHSKRVAELALKDAEVKSARGEYLGIYEEKKMLFEDLAEEYLVFSKANKAYSSYERDTRSLRVHLVRYFKGSYVFELTSQMIETYKARRLEKVGPATVNRELSCLRHMLNKAVEWRYIGISPMKGVKLLKEPPGRLRYLRPEEASALLANCAPRVRSVVVTALHTGMRRSEILNLKWGDIDFRTRIITVQKSKNNERRMIPMNDILQAELNSVPRDIRSQFVFCNREGKPFARVYKGFKGALRRAGIEDFRFQDLRHTFASYLVMNGVDLRTVQQLMGHKSLRMTMRYAHLSEAHARKAVDTLARVGHNLVTMAKTADNADRISSCKIKRCRGSSVGRARD